MSRRVKTVLIGSGIVGFGLGGLLLLWLWAAGIEIIDPAPKGEGSYKELDRVMAQFRKYYRTKDPAVLPAHYVRLQGESDNPKAPDTWMIYYATASHKMISGGTIVLMDSTGRIDGYFGHHCSKSDGGTVGISSRWHLIWRGGDSSFEKTEDVRQAFDHTFSHQNTEQIAAADRD